MSATDVSSKKTGRLAGSWRPVSIQQDYVGSYHEAVSVGQDGKVYVRPALMRDIADFARVWDRNLKAQGFVAEAEAQAGRRGGRATR